MNGHQLTLELGPIPSTAPPAPLPPASAAIDLELVVCHICTGRHPVERCPARTVCQLCTGRHQTAAHE